MATVHSGLIDRWDLTIQGTGAAYPSWVEIAAGEQGLGGRFVGRVGSARPLASVEVDGSRVEFSLPPQYEARKDDLRFVGSEQDNVLEGITWAEDGKELSWTAKRAPDLPARSDVQWGEAVNLLSGDLREMWTPRSADLPFNWSLHDGLLDNSAYGSDLVLNSAQGDFRLIAEYRYPAKSNSGIYLRGRYEVQILDDFGAEASVTSSGAIYGFLQPSTNQVARPDEWQVCDITLLGRWVTIELNGQKVIDQQEIPGITGGALDSDEGLPGRLFLQGDHGPITFRRLELIPAI
jgi:hypothetical protein